MSQYGAYISGFEVVDYHTDSTGTEITENIQARDGKRLALISLDYTNGATAHTMDLMYPGGTRTTVSTAVSSGTEMVVATAPKDPGGNAAASGDVIAYQCSDKSWEFNTVSSLASTTITLGTSVSGTVAAGAKFCVFGVTGDGAKMVVGLTASETTEMSGKIIAVNPYSGWPMYMYDANATNAGKLNHALWAHINK